MRLRRVAGTEETLLSYNNWVVRSNDGLAGSWHNIFANDRPIHIEIGCGRGKFIAALARENPEINFIAIEVQGEVIVDAVRRVRKDFPANLRFFWQNAGEIDAHFNENEVDRIYLNFSDPWPKKRHAKRRLTHTGFLNKYKNILVNNGNLIFKTDGLPLFDFSLNQLLLAGFSLENVDRNYAGGDPETEYESRFRKQGKPIYRVISINKKYEEDLSMKYTSTRNSDLQVNAAHAIRSGLAPDGGLFVPTSIPKFKCDWNELAEMDYNTLAQIILGTYLTDYDAERIEDIVAKSYNAENFAHEAVAPLVTLNDNTEILELWHGPTAAFKDMALQIMPRLLVEAVKILGGDQEVDILVATSGDTGKAALEGFKNVDGIKVICFYPHNGVSKVQELQMSTTNGNNTYVVAVKGNFDHCQTAVKNIFGDNEFAARLSADNKEFSSANSINWGRLLPQVVYYFWSYAQLIKKGKLSAGDKFNAVVPTGNFGNILAAYYAKEMGLPINKLICASNSNKVLADVLETGTYDRRRDFVKTTSPSMDILVSSNFERFYYAMSNGDSKLVGDAFRQLSSEGIFTVPADILAKWQGFMLGGYAPEAEVEATIKETFDATGYTLDPHTAVALRVYEDYKTATGDETITVIASTASPYKFPKAVLHAITGEDKTFASEQAMLEHLAEVSKTEIHRGLMNLEEKPVLHNTVVEVEEMPAIVGKLLEV